jgi:hypothetical protein
MAYPACHSISAMGSDGCEVIDDARAMSSIIGMERKGKEVKGKKDLAFR